jgi:organic radical activating enzyme
MERIQHFIQRFFKPAELLPPGIYQYQAPANAAAPLRLHLRLEAGGEGLLIVNASTVLRLNQTAAELAYHLVQQTPVELVGQQLAARYHIAPEAAAKDFLDFKERLDILVNTPDLDPVGFLGFERSTPYSAAVSAPYRLDCALTYQLNEENSAHLAPRERVKRELLTEEWQIMLDKAWKAGIPHVVFTGGEPTLRPDLPELIAYTERTGMVCGLLTDGVRLSDPYYLRQVLQAGLDYVMLLLDPVDPAAWEALRDLLAEDISTTVHLTLTLDNSAEIPALFDRLKFMGVKLISLSTDEPALHETQRALRDLAAEVGLSLVWDIPVPYSAFHPVALETPADEQPQAAGRAWLYIEPDGDVLPAQGVDTVMGNLLSEPWEAIWANRPK